MCLRGSMGGFALANPGRLPDMMSARQNRCQAAMKVLATSAAEAASGA